MYISVWYGIDNEECSSVTLWHDMGFYFSGFEVKYLVLSSQGLKEQPCCLLSRSARSLQVHVQSEWSNRPAQLLQENV